MWTLLEKKEAEKLVQLFAESSERLQVVIRGHELSSDEISELNSRKYVDPIKNVDEKVKIDTLPIIETLASLKYILNRIESRCVSKNF